MHIRSAFVPVFHVFPFMFTFVQYLQSANNDASLQQQKQTQNASVIPSGPHAVSYHQMIMLRSGFLYPMIEQEKLKYNNKMQKIAP